MLTILLMVLVGFVSLAVDVGWVRLAKTLSEQLRSRKARCRATIVLFTAPAEAKGPK